MPVSIGQLSRIITYCQRPKVYLMKITEKGAKEKRVRKNATIRKWYAQLPQWRKDALLLKNRKAYASRKNRQRLGTMACKIVDDSNRPQTSENDRPDVRSYELQTTSVAKKAIGDSRKHKNDKA